MRIYYASMDSANTSLMPGSKIWFLNLFMTLSKKHQMIRPDFSAQEQHLKTVKIENDEIKKKNKIFFSEKLFKHIEKENNFKKIDLFFSYFYNDSIEPEIIKKIKDLGIITVNFYCNSVHQFDNVALIAPLYDFAMFPEKEAFEKYKKIGANPIHIQMAANPDYYKPFDINEIFDVTFVGQNYLNRKDYIKYIFLNDIDIKVYGPNWRKRTFAPENIIYNNDFITKVKRKLNLYRTLIPVKNIGGALSDLDLIKMYSKSKISLNFSEVIIQDNSIENGIIKRHIRLRDFEAPMSRAFYMTGYQEELKEYYEIEKEIVCFDSKEELVDKIKFYLSHKESRDKIRNAGYQRALKDHTWDNRFDELFKKIGLKNE